MRKGFKQSQAQLSVQNLEHIDFHDIIQREMLQSDLEISRDLGISVREVRYLKKNFKK